MSIAKTVIKLVKICVPYVCNLCNLQVVHATWMSYVNVTVLVEIAVHVQAMETRLFFSSHTALKTVTFI